MVESINEYVAFDKILTAGTTSCNSFDQGMAFAFQLLLSHISLRVNSTSTFGF